MGLGLTLTALLLGCGDEDGSKGEGETTGNPAAMSTGDVASTSTSADASASTTGGVPADCESARTPEACAAVDDLCGWYEAAQFDPGTCSFGERQGSCYALTELTAGCAGPPCEVDGARPLYDVEQTRVLFYDGVCGQLPNDWVECHAGADDDLDICSCYCDPPSGTSTE